MPVSLKPQGYWGVAAQVAWETMVRQLIPLVRCCREHISNPEMPNVSRKTQRAFLAARSLTFAKVHIKAVRAGKKLLPICEA